MLPFVQKCAVPADLESVTALGGDETDPREVGLDPAVPQQVWDAVCSYYASGVHPAIQICLRRHGRVVLHRAIGHASGNGPDDAPEAPKVACTTATPFNIFSASKAVTAMLVHLLDEQGHIRLDDPVCEYIPEFARHKKQWITIRHILMHRAGIPSLPENALDLDHLEHPERIIELLCELKPETRAGRRLAYHAITGGFVLGEVIRRVTGKDIRGMLTRSVRKPLGFRWLNYGVAPADVGRVARNEITGLPPVPPLSNLVTKALGVELHEACRMSNDPRFLTAIVPAGNVVCTAEELSRFFQLLLDDGEQDGVRVFEPRTVRRATLEQSYAEFDLNLIMPIRYSLGFMLGADYLSIYGPDTRHAFGHLGFTNVVGWADRERQISGAVMTSGKPLLYPELYQAWGLMRTIGTLFPKSARRTRPAPARRRPGKSPAVAKPRRR